MKTLMISFHQCSTPTWEQSKRRKTKNFKGIYSMGSNETITFGSESKKKKFFKEEGKKI